MQAANAANSTHVWRFVISKNRSDLMRVIVFGGFACEYGVSFVVILP
jgi:hypothetical protein